MKHPVSRYFSQFTNFCYTRYTWNTHILTIPISHSIEHQKHTNHTFSPNFSYFTLFRTTWNIQFLDISHNSPTCYTRYTWNTHSLLTVPISHNIEHQKHTNHTFPVSRYFSQFTNLVNTWYTWNTHSLLPIPISHNLKHQKHTSNTFSPYLSYITLFRNMKHSFNRCFSHFTFFWRTK